jgi:hypothetical protein
LVEKGLSTMEPQTLMRPPGELVVVGNPRMFPTIKVPMQSEPPSIAYGRQPVANWWFRWQAKCDH